MKMAAIKTSYFTIVIFLCLCIFRCKAGTGPTHGKAVVCYVASWAVHRVNGMPYNVEDFDPNLCTHVVYVFTGLDAEKNNITIEDEYHNLDRRDDVGNFRKWTNLKRSYPHLKVSLGLGGYAEGSQGFSAIASDPLRREQFANNIASFLQAYNFDGLALHWETPTQRGGSPSDRRNFVLLLSTMRDAFREHDMIITAFIASSPSVIDEAYDLPALSNVVDYFHVKSFDYGGRWDEKITAPAPLQDPNGDSVERTIEHLLEKGADPGKITVGVPFNGYQYTTDLAGNIGDDLDLLEENGYMGYYEICKILDNEHSEWSIEWKDDISQSFARRRNNTTGKTTVFFFDSGRSIVRKVRYAMERKLGGVMAYSIDADDFQGACNTRCDSFIDMKRGPCMVFPKYPLLSTINEVIYQIQEQTDKFEYSLMLMKFHMDLNSIEPYEEVKCEVVGDMYLRMMEMLKEFYSKYLTNNRN